MLTWTEWKKQWKKRWAFFIWIGLFFGVLFLGLGGPCIWPKPFGYPWTFWNYWEVGALVSTAIYNLIFYAIGFFVRPQMFRKLPLEYAGLMPFLFAGAVVCLFFATKIALVEGDCRIQLGLLLGVAVCFFWVDHSMAHHSTIEKVREDFRASVKLNDTPALFAFAVLLFFSMIYPICNKTAGGGNIHDALFRAFIGGAVAFQMIASNWALALIFLTPGEQYEDGGNESLIT